MARRSVKIRLILDVRLPLNKSQILEQSAVAHGCMGLELNKVHKVHFNGRQYRVKRNTISIRVWDDGPWA